MPRPLLVHATRALRLQGPVAAPLPLGPHGLKLKLDAGSVLSAWAARGGGSAAPHPFQLRGPELEAATAALPSADDLAASLAAAAQAGASADPAPVAPAAAPQAPVARPAKAAEQRKPSKKASDRKVRCWSEAARVCCSASLRLAGVSCVVLPPLRAAVRVMFDLNRARAR